MVGRLPAIAYSRGEDLSGKRSGQQSRSRTPLLEGMPDLNCFGGSLSVDRTGRD